LSQRSLVLERAKCHLLIDLIQLQFTESAALKPLTIF
jgi:hypothetical protein